MILGGPALFLAGHAAFKLVVWRTVSWPRLTGIAVLALLGLAATAIPELGLAACAAGVVAAVAAAAGRLECTRRTDPGGDLSGLGLDLRFP
jgi:low temperature requirement protein LtrA